MQTLTVTTPLSVFCFWIRGTYTLTDRSVEISEPNRILGCIPVGRRNSSIPLWSISGVQIDSWYSVGEIIAGIIALLLGIVAFSQSAIMALIIILFAIGVILCSIHTRFRIQNNGTEYAVDIPFYGKKQITRFARALSASMFAAH